jgi:hypothetical protein
MGEVSLARRFDFFALAGVVPVARGVVERADVVSQRVDVCVCGFTVRVAFDCEIETEGITKIVRKVDFVDVFGEVDAPAVEDAPAPAPAPSVDAENVVPAKKSLASMREGFKSKIAAPAGAERRTFGALKDVNAQ